MLLLVAVTLAGCSTAYNAVTKTGRVLWNPSVQVGADTEQASTVDLSMVAESDMNADGNGLGAPMSFQVLQLKDDSKLMAADYAEVSDDLENALGTNYIDHDDFALLPRQFKFYESFDVDPETRFIGVIAYYNDPDHAEWKKVVRIRPKGHRYHILVHLRNHTVELRREY
nr:type VI secretion system lipoprotein TssJ [Larsenimonas suaedae]